MKTSRDIFVEKFGPLPAIGLSSVPELGDIVRRAAAEGQVIYPIGGGTMLRRATRRRLDDALDGIERAVGDSGA